MKPVAKVACALIALSTLSACVAGSSEAHHMAQSGALSQFLLGLWHGVIAPVTLIIEIINHFAPHALPWTAHFIEKDSGVFYDIGIYLGVGGGPTVVFANSRRRAV
jgi:hypothetical protein